MNGRTISMSFGIDPMAILMSGLAMAGVQIISSTVTYLVLFGAEAAADAFKRFREHKNDSLKPEEVEQTA